MLHIGKRVLTDPNSRKLLKLLIIYIKKGDKNNHILINHRELLINLLWFFPNRSVSVLLIKVSYVVVQRSSLFHYLEREVRERSGRNFISLMQFIEFLCHFKNNKENCLENRVLSVFARKLVSHFVLDTLLLSLNLSLVI